MLCGGMSLAVAAEIKVRADSTLVTDTPDVGLVSCTTAERSITVYAKVADLSRHSKRKRLVDWHKAV